MSCRGPGNRSPGADHAALFFFALLTTLAATSIVAEGVGGMLEPVLHIAGSLQPRPAAGARTGLVFHSISGESSQPSALGSTRSLCVKTPTQRTPTQSSGGAAGQCDGALAIDFANFMAAHPGALGQPISAGQTFYAQAWQRDPPVPKTTNLSNGLHFTLVP